jgi:hypothetical protein
LTGAEDLRGPTVENAMVMAMYLEDAADGRWTDDGGGSVSGKGGFYLIYICLVGGAESVVVVVAVWWLLCGWWWWVVETHFFLILSPFALHDCVPPPCKLICLPLMLPITFRSRPDPLSLPIRV